jgi:hypothetical protein
MLQMVTVVIARTAFTPSIRTLSVVGIMPTLRRLMNDKLAKLGYRLRSVKREAFERPGEIKFDERGNAIYQWKNSLLEGDSKEASKLREMALEHPGLSLMDDDPPPDGPIRANPKAARLGYNPYESGLIVKKTTRRKTDLRELSRWIEMKRRLEAQKKKSREK